MCAHIPGLKVVFPATPYDAKGLMYSALLGTDPVVFFESQRIYDQPELFHDGGVPVDAYEIPIGEPDVKKAGNDLTLLSIGAAIGGLLMAAGLIAAEPWVYLAGCIGAGLCKLWFLDRLVWLYEDMAREVPEYRAWLR